MDSRDVEFLLAWLDLDALLRRERFSMHDADGIRAIVALTEQIAERELAPHLRASDLREPSLDEDGRVSVLPEIRHALSVMAEAGLFSTVFDAEQGGLQLPHTIHMAMMGVLMSANLSTASYAMLTIANARLLATHASPQQIETFARAQIAGAEHGTMCMSEPHAGSSLGDIRTRAVAEHVDALGERFRIKGEKMWISGGDHDAASNIIHLVLAKIPARDGDLPEGTRGISLFIVPKVLPDGQRNDVVVTSLNHKMGYRGIPNCALSLGGGIFRPDGGDGAIGWLVGLPGQGLSQMFLMMNEARISVGLAATMLACRGYRMACEYAHQRLQGRPPGVADGPQVAIVEHADVRRMLLAQKALSQGALSLVLYSARLLDDEYTAETVEARELASALLGLLTPITKSWPSEWMQVSLHLALQVHGGAGYTRDFGIEQLFRDNRLNPIHEGTTGIQAIDLVRRKLRKDGGRSFATLARLIRDSIARSGDEPVLGAAATQLEEALVAVERAVAVLLAEPDETRALAHATPFLNAFGHLVVGWLWLDQALFATAAQASADYPFDRTYLGGRIRACLYFAETELPTVAVWLGPLVAGSTLALNAPAEEF